MVVYTYNPSTWDAKVGGLQIQGPPGLHHETMTQNKLQVFIQKHKLLVVSFEGFILFLAIDFGV